MSEAEASFIDKFKFLLGEEAWMREGTCRIEGAPRAYFVLENGQHAAPGRQYCRRCPVRQQCLDYGLRTGSVGLWGGEVLDLSNREGIELTDLRIQDARPVHLEHIANPPPLKAHQLPVVLFKPPTNPTQG